MKNWLIIGIVMALAFGAARVVFTTNDAIDTEVKNYVKGLKYKLTARVDSVVVYDARARNVKGFLSCSLTSGRFSRAVEDSLASQLKEHKRLRILFPSEHGFKLYVGDLKKFVTGDSLIIDSDVDRIAVFRGGESVKEWKVTNAWVGKVSFAFWIPD